MWDQVTGGTWGDTLQTLEYVARAWRRYNTMEIDDGISEHEDMIGSDPISAEGYRQVGLTALRIFSEAMVLTGRIQFQDILDLPCGGGRVTRHLRAFFPEARLHVGDIDTDKLASAIAQFGAERFNFPHDFRGDPERAFDLIFSGSLLTHFDEDMFARAVDFFVRALNPSGLAILTTHGRSNATLSLAPDAVAAAKQVADDFRSHMRQVGKNYKLKLDIEQAISHSFSNDGFGFVLSPSWTSMYGQKYGGSYSSPSWLMNLFERRSDCIIIGFKEKSYGGMQDVITVQKL